jgi:ABC-type taurine transport system substrate-binding protein
VTFAYQDMMNPWRWVQQSGEVEKTTGIKINFRQFGGGASGAAAKALTQQANFLKEQGRLTSVAPDYSKSVTTEWVTKAMK